MVSILHFSNKIFIFFTIRGPSVHGRVHFPLMAGAYGMADESIIRGVFPVDIDWTALFSVRVSPHNRYGKAKSNSIAYTAPIRGAVEYKRGEEKEAWKGLS